MSFWKEDNYKKTLKTLYRDLESKVDDFFEEIYNKSGNFTYTAESGETCVVEKKYRESQHNYALDIVDAIRNNKILLIEAGVGLGKSWGYLIPIFNSFIVAKDSGIVRFNKVVISTSNIALQNQLIRDIELISKDLDFSVSAVIAKGVNNYACIKRIESAINSSYTFDDRREELKSILKRIEETGSCDKTDFEDISKKVWENINLSSRGYCSKCTHVKRCPFYKKEKKIKTSNIIITNHANYISNVIKSANNDRDEVLFTDNIDMLVIDEAHQMETNLINVLKEELRLDSIYFILDCVKNYIIDNVGDGINVDDYNNYIDKVEKKFRELFVYIKKSASIRFAKCNKNNNSITDGEKLSFNTNKSITNLVSENSRKLLYLLEKIEQSEPLTKKQKKKKENISDILKLLIGVLEDMLLGDESKNIYWVSFFEEEKINLGYVVKDKSDVLRMMYNRKSNSGENASTVFTSATMRGSDGSFRYFRERNGLDKLGRPIEESEIYYSPFDYDNNALFYYDKDIASPNDKDNNVRELALKISELIRITNGKTLVLFTSKARMKEVYDLITMQEFPFKILMQDEFNTNVVRKEFEDDVNSCLFSTGLWEGISIKGKSLSNVIITRLPFDTVDAINRFEASKYSSNRDKMENVYIPNMLSKLVQGIGRLIRTDTDTGVVCCLDSRIKRYLDVVHTVSPIKNFTDDKKELIRFSDEKINGSEIDLKSRVLV